MSTTESETPDEPIVTEDSRPMPTNVTQAIARVMGELPAIGKEGVAAASQGGYAYRGIEQITREAQRLFARYGVVFVPRVVGHTIENIQVQNKPWTDTILEVEYDVFGPSHVGGQGSTVDMIVVGPLVGIGRDNSDKGANKAMTQVFKYALLQVLCISDAKDDADGYTHEADEGGRPGPRVITDDMARVFRKKISALPVERQEVVGAQLVAEGIPYPEQMSLEQYGRAEQVVYEQVLGAHTSSGAQGVAPPPPTGDPLNLLPGAEEPESTEMIAARQELSAIVLMVPRDGTRGREVLQSNLRGKLGDPDTWGPEEVRKAIAIATAWPEEPPASEMEPQSQETPYTPPSAAEEPADGQTPDLPPPTAQVGEEPLPTHPAGVPAEAADEIEAEIALLDASGLKEELRALGLPLSGTKPQLVTRLTGARFVTYVAEHPA